MVTINDLVVNDSNKPKVDNKDVKINEDGSVSLEVVLKANEMDKETYRIELIRHPLTMKSYTNATTMFEGEQVPALDISLLDNGLKDPKNSQEDYNSTYKKCMV